jgi:glycosyltransferase involved in cell wall biosynthesis
MAPIRIAIVHNWPITISETFIRAHAERLPGVSTVFHVQDRLPAIDGRAVLDRSWGARAIRKGVSVVFRRELSRRSGRAWEIALRRANVDVVLAEYGTTGAWVAEPCTRVGVPLVAHFHGFDAAKTATIQRSEAAYQYMFGCAAAVVAVSRAMKQQLLDLGCPKEKLVYNPYGVDVNQFGDAAPAEAAPQFLAVGRLIEKKGPHLTLAAFARALQMRPEIRLCFIGDGALLSVCQDFAQTLAIGHAVQFLGAQPHDAVAREMRRSRAFVQHSVGASDGDREGTPVAVLEAGAAGLPVISTRHAGIPDVVIHGYTGLLVDERDIEGMAAHMVSLATNAQFAGELGRAAASHVRQNYTMDQSIRRLARIVEAAARRKDIAAVRDAIESELPSAAQGHGAGSRPQRALAFPVRGAS